MSVGLPPPAGGCGRAAGAPLPIVLRCGASRTAKARYVLDTLLMAAGIACEYVDEPPRQGPWLLYADAPRPGETEALGRCLALAQLDSAWAMLAAGTDASSAPAATRTVDGVALVFPEVAEPIAAGAAIRVDVVANAFYFLSSWPERHAARGPGQRVLAADSVYSRLGIPRDIVDRYLRLLLDRLDAVAAACGRPIEREAIWGPGTSYALLLSHDIDFLPAGAWDIAVQGAKTVMRHLVRQRDPADAMQAAAGLARAAFDGRDPYGCVPEMIARERELGVKASYQIAVARRHPRDVNYDFEDERTLSYLQSIPQAGFEVCLHGSYRSTERAEWYLEEAEMLAARLQRPAGSRQHYLSFDYDTLFTAQEAAGIRYDMSMGYPDSPGPRAGFSYPYFPYCLKEDRPYRVLQVSLFLMDVTLRGYLNKRAAAAWPVVEAVLADLRAKGGGASVVWHPIVFGGARDPGYDELFWRLVAEARSQGALCSDGATISGLWRRRARRYASFATA